MYINLFAIYNIIIIIYIIYAYIRLDCDKYMDCKIDTPNMSAYAQ